jgi:hypothetical protein
LLEGISHASYIGCVILGSLLRTFGVSGQFNALQVLEELGKMKGWQERSLRFSFNQFLNPNCAFL